MVDHDKMVRKKRQIGSVIVILGVVLGSLALILDLALNGEVKMGQTTLYLLLGGLTVAALGAIYIGAGMTSVVRKQAKQIKLMKNQLYEKEKEIKDQRSTMETMSDSRLKGLSETVDKMDILAKSKVMTELPKKTEGQQAPPDIGNLNGPTAPPKGQFKVGKWESKSKASTPPPPKPKGGPTKPSLPKSPKGIPLPPKPISSKSPPKGPQEELIEDIIKEEARKDQKTAIEQMNCPNCGQAIKGQWVECPFCDTPLTRPGASPSGDDGVPSPTPIIKDKETKDSVSPMQRAPPDNSKKESLIDSVLDQVIAATPTQKEKPQDKGPSTFVGGDEKEHEEGSEGPIEGKETNGPPKDELEEAEPRRIDADKDPNERIVMTPNEKPDGKPDERLEPARVKVPEFPGPPKEQSIAPYFVSPTSKTDPTSHATMDKGTCPNCKKTVKPHWRNCPYCKFSLKK